MRWLIPVLMLCFGLLITSCRQYRYVYAASKIHTPGVHKKGDSRLNASFSFGNAKGMGDSSTNAGYDLQGAYAFTDHFAVMGSYYFRKEADNLEAGFYRDIDFDESFVRYRRHLLEIGFGYLTATNKHVNFNIYGGASFGRFSIRDQGLIDSSTYSRHFNAGLQKFFLQPGFTIFNRKNGIVDLAMRLTYLHAGTKSTDYQPDELDYFNLKPAGARGKYLLVEPTVNFQFAMFGNDWLRMETGLSWTNRGNIISTRAWNLSLGLTFDPAKAFKH